MLSFLDVIDVPSLLPKASVGFVKCTPVSVALLCLGGGGVQLAGEPGRQRRG